MQCSWMKCIRIIYQCHNAHNRTPHHSWYTLQSEIHSPLIPFDFVDQWWSMLELKWCWWCNWNSRKHTIETIQWRCDCKKEELMRAQINIVFSTGLFIWYICTYMGYRRLWIVRFTLLRPKPFQSGKNGQSMTEHLSELLLPGDK